PAGVGGRERPPRRGHRSRAAGVGVGGGSAGGGSAGAGVGRPPGWTAGVTVTGRGPDRRRGPSMPAVLAATATVSTVFEKFRELSSCCDGFRPGQSDCPAVPVQRCPLGSPLRQSRSALDPETFGTLGPASGLSAGAVGHISHPTTLVVPDAPKRSVREGRPEA